MRSQSGHLSTYLLPWIAGAGVAGAIAGTLLGGDPAVCAVVSGAAALCGYIGLSVLAGMLAVRRDAAAAREAVRAWVAARRPGALALDATCRLVDGYVTDGLSWERTFGGVITRYTALGLDAAGGLAVLARDAKLDEIVLKDARSWRRSSDPPGEAHRLSGPLFVLELPPSGAWKAAGAGPVSRLEILARPADVAALEESLHRALGAPSAAKAAG